MTMTSFVDAEKCYRHIAAQQGISNKELFSLLGITGGTKRIKLLKDDDRLFCQDYKGGIRWYTNVYAAENAIPKIYREDNYAHRKPRSAKAKQKSRAGPGLRTGDGDRAATATSPKNVRWLDRIMIPTQ